MNRRGSYIAEAAVVMPIIILAVITVVLILMYFYEESITQSKLHVELRREAAVAADRQPEVTERNCMDSVAVLDVSRKVLFKNVTGSICVRMANPGILKAPGKTAVEGSWCAADGVLYTRMF